MNRMEKDLLAEQIYQLPQKETGTKRTEGKSMEAKLIDPKNGAVVRRANDAEDLARCLLAVQEGAIPLYLQLGDGPRRLLLTPWGGET